MKLEIRSSVAAQALIAFAAAAVYANSLWNGFALDDNFIILDNPRVHDLSAQAEIWLTPYWTFAGAELGLYRPGIIFLYAVQWALGGGAPWLFHAVSVLLHVAASLLVFVLLRRLTSMVPALVGALVFAVHPVHTEAVANVVGQAEIVAALCVIAACAIHAARPPGVQVSWWRRLAYLILFAAALTTKESAVVMPALLVIVDLAQRRVRPGFRAAAEYADAMLMPALLLAAALAAYLVVRYEVMGGALIGIDAAPSMPFLREEYRVLNALRAFPEMLRLLVLPTDLAADYSPAALLPVETVRPMVVLGTALLTGLVLLTLLMPWFPAAGFPAAWFLISIITVSNLFFPVGIVIAERTLYLPSVAIAALIAFAWQAGASRASVPARRLVLVLTPLVIALFAVRTWVRNPVWDSTETVWASMVRDQPQSYRTQWISAMQAWKEGRFAEAHEHFELAHRLYSRDGGMLTEFGNFLMATGQFEAAIPLLEDAYRTHGWIVRTTVTLMHAYLANGRYDEAAHTAHAALRTGGTPATAFPVLAYAHQQAGRFGEAVAAWSLAVRYTPAAPWQLHGFLARARAAAGYPEAARAGLDSARTAISDAVALRVLATVDRAVENGCYARAARSMLGSGQQLPPDRPLGLECDELGHWFTYLLRAQNANALQNARLPAAPAPSGGGDEVAENVVE